MSKIEDAIRKASLSKDKGSKRGLGEAEARDDIQDTQSRLALVIYRLEASRKHLPSAAALERNRIIRDGYSDEALTNYKMLRTRILQEYNANEWKTLAITSPQDGAGKSVIAINLAIALASHGGHEIYLVDLDMRNPSIANYLDLPADIPGLAAYLNREEELDGMLWDVGVENLVVLANRDRMANSSEQITSKRMRELIDTFKTAAPKPIVIFDLPPVLTADDAVAMGPSVDGILMVVAEGETQRDDLAHGLDLLRGANILGIVLNKSDGP